MCCLPALQTADRCPCSPSCPPHPPRLSLLGVEGQGGGGTETLGCWGCLDFCICVFAKEDRVGQGTCWRRPQHWHVSVLPVLTLTCACVGCSRVLPPGGETAAGAARGRAERAASSRGPGSILPRLFIPYSVTFLFYFTLIMIIQEYYLR